MGAIKNYMMELADKLGKEFDEVTNEDIQRELYNQAQEIFLNGASSQEELEKSKAILPTKNVSEVKYGKVGEVIQDATGTFFLIVA